ncbi:MAG: ABC transporter [Gammaproteobacteria bacterium]|nr:MAG: ABC transporter [Gammaproteobacteria bacterium]RLA15807.1 MAG: ABC transporter [Gammaproteobacteria bacterium]RLA17242.1 MAG: ABC transporter [Gammaproteobacteria bacterium]
MNRKLVSLSSLVIALVLLFAINILSGLLFSNARLDMTEQQLYTLTPGSRAILDKLEDDITLNFYFSDDQLRDVPAIKAYAVRVEELLNEYVSLAHGKIQLRVVDPEPFSEQEDEAVRAGVHGVPINDIGETAYFGLTATNTTDGEEVIGFFSPSNEELLEHDLTRMIYKLDHPEKPVVAVYSSLPVAGSEGGQGQRAQPSWTIIEQMREIFDVRVLKGTLSKIEDDVDILMIIHPQMFDDASRLAIDQFVLGGGRTMVFVDPYSDVEVIPTMPFMQNQQEPKAPSDFDQQLAAWGVRVDGTQVVGDYDAARRVTTSRNPGDQPQPYLPWLELKNQHFDQDDVVTSSLASMFFATAGAIEKLPDSEVTLQVLVITGSNSGPVPVGSIQFSPNPKELLGQFQPVGPQILAARLSGKIRSAYPDGPPEGVEWQGELLTESADAQIVLVADSDLLHDRFWVEVQDFFGDRIAVPYGDNGNFVINTLDNLSGSSDLISVRSRGTFSRPFTRIVDLGKVAEEQFRATEQQLQGRLQTAEQRLAELQKQGTDALLLDQQAREEIDDFLQEKVAIRKQLRTVQHDLRRDIESLETRVKFVNIGLMPLLIIFLALMAWLTQSRRRGG